MKKTVTGVMTLVLLATVAVACIPEPPGFPMAGRNDGVPAGTTLTTYAGPTTISTAGTVIDAADISSCLTIDAPNVHITRSRITCSAVTGVRQGDGAFPDHDSTGLLIQDSEITSPSGAMSDWGVLLKNTATIQRVFIHGQQRGVSIASNTTITDSYIGGAVLSAGGAQNVVLRHNALIQEVSMQGSAAVTAFPQPAFGGANNNWIIDNNLLDSVGTYCMTVGFDAAQGESPNTNFTVTGNFFGTGLAATCGTSGPIAFQGLNATIYNTTFVAPVASGGWGWTWGDHGANAGALNTWYDFTGPKDANGNATPGPLHGQTVLP